MMKSSNKFFRSDNPYNEVMTKVFDVIWLNILWLVFSIPIITIGASTASLYHVMMALVRDEEGGITASYWRFFRENFRKVSALYTDIAPFYRNHGG